LSESETNERRSGAGATADDDRRVTALRARAAELLVDMYGQAATFRDDQLEAIIELVLERRRELLVKRTGWGKSLVYFLATKLLREAGGGITLVISPLLSLMRNQIEMAQALGLRACTINSSNQDKWPEVRRQLESGQCDILLVAPERLANEEFLNEILPSIAGGIGLLVVDEAHCISDWGHDFRPDYRRIVRIVQLLPKNVPMLATTATANARVVQDIADQLGPDLSIRRGALARPSLRLQTIKLEDQAERLAWLAQHLNDLPGTGIIYCLTIRDCEMVARWLSAKGIDARSYHGEMDNAERQAVEQELLENRVKAVVATIALGMGFDKPDLGFVVHFQRPGSVVAYYQQVGRAGRAVDEAFAVLLNGREDDEIQQYFIETAFPSKALMQEVLAAIEATDSITLDGLMQQMNVQTGKLLQCLQFLQLEGAVLKQGTQYVRSLNPWTYDEAEAAAITALRGTELTRMHDYVETADCSMEFVAKELDDPEAAPCGRCANCNGNLVSPDVDQGLVREAVAFLRRSSIPFEPRKRWPTGVVAGWQGNIPPGLRNEPGRALCVWEDAGWGRLVKRAKYDENRVSDELLEAAAALIRDDWNPQPRPEWLTIIPSTETPDLLRDFGRRLAERLEIPFREALRKTRPGQAQKSMKNSHQQLSNVWDAFEVVPDQVIRVPALLVDDVMNSGWSLTVAGRYLREAGVSAVHPFVLAKAHS